MNVVGVDPYASAPEVSLTVGSVDVKVPIPLVSMDEMLGQADIVTLHVPFTGVPVLSTAEFAKMKDGVVLVNAARGGTVDEDALLEALNSDKVKAAGLDVFENEPTPRADLINHPNVSCTPHIGASTGEAQENIGVELADKLISILG